MKNTEITAAAFIVKEAGSLIQGIKDLVNETPTDELVGAGAGSAAGGIGGYTGGKGLINLLHTGEVFPDTGARIDGIFKTVDKAESGQLGRASKFLLRHASKVPKATGVAGALAAGLAGKELMEGDRLKTLGRGAATGLGTLGGVYGGGIAGSAAGFGLDDLLSRTRFSRIGDAAGVLTALAGAGAGGYGGFKGTRKLLED